MKATAWAGLWYSRNKLDGITKHLLYENCLPKLFKTRRETISYIRSKYGYIRSRDDLRREPFGWRMPRAIRVSIIASQSTDGKASTKLGKPK